MLLLDTCILIWLDTDPPKVSAAAQEAIRANAGSLFVSAISMMEIAIKCRKGKLSLPLPPEQWFPQVLSAHGIAETAIDWPIALRSAQLPPLHADPCDRIIIATAQLRGMPIATPDPLIRAYPNVQIVW